MGIVPLVEDPVDFATVKAILVVESGRVAARFKREPGLGVGAVAQGPNTPLYPTQPLSFELVDGGKPPLKADFWARGPLLPASVEEASRTAYPTDVPRQSWPSTAH